LVFRLQQRGLVHGKFNFEGLDEEHPDHRAVSQASLKKALLSAALSSAVDIHVGNTPWRFERGNDGFGARVAFGAHVQAVTMNKTCP